MGGWEEGRLKRRGETDRIARAVFKSQREVAEGHKGGFQFSFMEPMCSRQLLDHNLLNGFQSAS